MKNNWTGPKCENDNLLFNMKPNLKSINLTVIIPLLISYACSYQIFVKQLFRKNAIDALGIDGQTAYRLCQTPEYLFIAKIIIIDMKDASSLLLVNIYQISSINNI